MASVNLTCNFTLTAPFDAEVAFESGGSANYGGQITIPTGVGGGGGPEPVTTGLWDSDGNVYFTIYDADQPSTNCVINSATDPGSFTPYITVAQSNGLACVIATPQPATLSADQRRATLLLPVGVSPGHRAASARSHGATSGCRSWSTDHNRRGSRTIGN